MVNKTFLPPARAPGETTNPFNNKHFPSWHDIRWRDREPRRFGRAETAQARSAKDADGLGGPIFADRFEGENHRCRMRFSSDFRGR